ncbi:MAG TPA: EVE domain-containing protein [Candidatus Paceibacterota bacterium]
MAATKRYWLMKSEPESYSIDHLKRDKKTPWSGVRNFQARNYMREMQPGDGVLFYHSSCAVPGVYGIGKVASKAHPDLTQFDPKSPYYDKRATKDKPIWDLVDVAFVRKLKRPVSITEMRANKKLSGMATFRKGSRLSVTPVTATEFEAFI